MIDIYYHPTFLEHDTGEHPERKERLMVTRETLLDTDIDLAWVVPEPASAEAVAKVHDPAYVDSVRRLAEDGGGWLDYDTVVSPRSYEAALLAVGSGLAAVDSCLATGRLAFMLVRPPGHHACPSRGMGFCLFNNIALAAAHAVTEAGLERVLIVDWDVHHGNGTHSVFYDDRRVLFFSMHQSGHYPGTGSAKEVGSGDGAGYTINVPLRAGDGDGAILFAFESLLLPVARAFKPQLVLVSAGYDGQSGDPLGGLSYSEASFRWMASQLRALSVEIDASGPLVFLEGGYVPRMLASSVVATLKGMEGQIPAFDPVVTEAAHADVQAAIAQVRPFWEGVL